MSHLLLALLLLLCVACRATPGVPGDSQGVEAALDAWHRAASEADFEGYFGGMSDDAAFLGTDASERWSKTEFQAYSEPYFKPGGGWTYLPSERFVAFSADGQLAWIDEKLSNASYGELRGTGVLRLDGGTWRIVHYSMSFPVPNDVTRDVVDLIRRFEQGEG